MNADVALLATLLACVGVVVGSFVNLAAVRLPRNAPIVWARSRAECCAETLSPGELVPVFSWLALRGRCRRCGARIAARHPLVELGGGVLGLWAGLAGGGPTGAVISALLAWQLLLLALIDADEMWLPDRLTGLLIVTGLAGAAWMPERSLTDALIGAALGFGALALIAYLYRRGRGREGLGDGDPILFAGLGAWVGWMGLPTVLLWACAAALSWIGARAILRRPWSPDRPLPFGPWLAVGGWLTWIFGPVGF